MAMVTVPHVASIFSGPLYFDGSDSSLPHSCVERILSCQAAEVAAKKRQQFHGAVLAATMRSQ